MKKKNRQWVVPLLWVIFLTVVTGIAIVSFQSGEETKQLGADWIYRLAQEKNPGKRITEEELLEVTYIVRQMAREIAFFVIGILGTITIHATCKKRSWFIKTEVSAIVLGVIAYLTEAIKKFIPTRHYSEEELMLSIGAAAAGFLIISLLSLISMGVKKLVCVCRPKTE